MRKIPKLILFLGLLALVETGLPLDLLAGDAGRAKRASFVRFEGVPLAVEVARRKTSDQSMGSFEQQDYLRRLKDSSQTTLKKIESLGSPIFWRYYRVLHGVQLELSSEERRFVERIDGVLSVHSLVEMSSNLDSSVSHVEATKVVEDLGFDGTGVRVGIIDSGIDYLHTAFGGAGTFAVYSANNGSHIDDLYEEVPLFPTAKVVGGYDFVGDGYAPGSVPPVPDPDPMPDHRTESSSDGNVIVFAEHGTHVAAIAAGVGNDEIGGGVAPGASLYALKVISHSTTTLSTAAIDWATDPNQDGDLSDCLDVLNLSLGSAFSGGSDNDEVPENSAIAAFTGLGGVVVASAGNNGNTPFIVSSPSSAQYALSVGNSYSDGETDTFLEVVEPADISGLMVAKEARESLAPQFEIVGAVEGELVFVSYGCDATDYPPEVAGRVALIKATQCKYVQKFQQAENAGAIGIVVIRKDGNPKFMGGTEMSGIPGVMVGSSDGALLEGKLVGGSEVRIRMASDYPRDDLTDTLSGGSSRGPAYPYRGIQSQRVIAKPDVSAPGVHIYAPQAGTGSLGVSKTGTSMSAPHVAGLIALVKQAHPDWSATELKAAVMNTAFARIFSNQGNPNFGGDGVEVAHSLQGSGRISSFGAVETTLLAYSVPGVTVDFGFHAVQEAQTLTRQMTVVNKGEAERTVALSFAWRQEAAEEGAQISFDESEFVLAPGEERVVEVYLDIDPAGLKAWGTDNHDPKDGFTDQGSRLDDVEYDGGIVITPLEGSSIRVPLYSLLKPDSKPVLSGGCHGPVAESFEFSASGGLNAQAELFTLLTYDGDEEGDLDIYDVESVGMRLVEFEELEHLQFAFHTRDYWMSPMRIHIAVFMDIDLDGTAEYLLVNFDDGYLSSDSLDGDVVTVLLKRGEIPPGEDSEFNFLGAGHEVVLKNRVISDLLSTNMVLSVPTISFDFGDGPRRMGVWFAVFDERERVWFPEDADDLIPDFAPVDSLYTAVESITLDLDCSLWSFSSSTFSTDTSLLLDATKWPTCRPEGLVDSPWPSPVMVLGEGAPGTDELEVVEIPDHTSTITCLEAMSLEVDEASCVASLDLTTIVEAGVCTGPVSADPLLFEDLELGEHDLEYKLLDPFGRSLACNTKVEVLDTKGPEVSCPVLWDELEPYLLQGAVTSSDSCGSDLNFVSGSCSNAKEEDTSCTFIYEEGFLKVELQSKADEVSWIMSAQDPSGNETLHTCWLPLPEPAYGPSPQSGGCVATPSSRSSDSTGMMVFFILFAFGFFTIRMKPC